MSEKRFEVDIDHLLLVWDTERNKRLEIEDIVDLLNDLNDECKFLAKERDYWKSKAMTLLMQVRRLTPRMSAKEVIEFGKELEDE